MRWKEDTGKTISLLSTELSDTDKDRQLPVTEDMDKTYRDIIDLILFEAVGYVIVYDPQNDGYRIKRYSDNARWEHQPTGK